MINGLISRKAYARTSAEPGKTQTINYYKVEVSREVSKRDRSTRLERFLCAGKKCLFVDLPGYGFAKVSMETKKSGEK